MRARIATRLFALLLVLSLPACGTRSQLVNMWVDPEYSPGPMRRVIVVACWSDSTSRQMWEGEFVAALAKNKVQGTSSYLMLPSAAPDSLEILAASRQDGCDGVLIVNQHHAETKTVYVPGYVTSTKRTYYDGDPENLQKKEVWVDEYHPGYEEKQSAVRCDVEVWSVLDVARIVWSGTTEVINPGSDDRTRVKVSDRVVFELSRCGLVPAGL